MAKPNQSNMDSGRTDRTRKAQRQRLVWMKTG